MWAVRRHRNWAPVQAAERKRMVRIPTRTHSHTYTHTKTHTYTFTLTHIHMYTLAHTYTFLNLCAGRILKIYVYVCMYECGRVWNVILTAAIFPVPLGLVFAVVNTVVRIISIPFSYMHTYIQYNTTILTPSYITTSRL